MGRPSPRRVLIYVQSLFGSGHLQRMAHLSLALTDLGIEVDLLSGGRSESLLDVSPARLHQLPPLMATSDSFSDLVDTYGDPITESWRQRRRYLLLSFLHRLQPQVLIVEMFPFGRRKLHFELLPLLQACLNTAPRPVVVCSVRDVLQTGRPVKHLNEMADRINTFFDYVLVHGDRQLIRFEETFPGTDKFLSKLKYTGFITRPPLNPEPAGAPGQNEIIVSAGSGVAGDNLFKVALQAAKFSPLKTRKWRFLVGNAVTEDHFIRMAKQAGDGVIVERARGDFYWLLKNCALSISQCGYNTFLDILQTGARAVIVPYTGSGETEQTYRASKLKSLGRVQTVKEQDLTVDTLVAAIEKEIARSYAQTRLPEMKGAENSAKFIDGLIQGSVSIPKAH